LPTYLPTYRPAAYISHATFTWRTLATEVADRQAAASKVKTASHSVEVEDEDPQVGLARTHRLKDTILDQLSKQQSASEDMPQVTAQASTSENPQHTKAGAKSAGSKGKAAKHSNTSAVAAASASGPAVSVDNVKFLLPTSTDETGVHALAAVHKQHAHVGLQPLTHPAILTVSNLEMRRLLRRTPSVMMA
jgi:hypothetical protein